MQTKLLAAATVAQRRKTQTKISIFKFRSDYPIKAERFSNHVGQFSLVNQLFEERWLGTIIINVNSDYSGISQGILWAFASSRCFPDYVAVGMLIVVVGLYLVLRVMWQIYQIITGGLQSCIGENVANKSSSRLQSVQLKFKI